MTLSETHETRIKRLSIQSKRRGLQEMDLLLGRFADLALRGLDAPELTQYEALINEPDTDIFNWIKAPQTTPPRHSVMVVKIRETLHL